MGVPDGFSWDWAVGSGGLLTRRQFEQLVAITLFSGPGLLSGKVQTFFGVQGSGMLTEEEMKFPDTRLAREAEREAVGSLSPGMTQHSYRTYYFGKALAKVSRAQYDDELSFVTCMLHDLELEHPCPGRCFAVRGAERADAFLTGLGETPERIEIVRDGIAFHINPGVDSNLSDTAGFVSAGAGVDLVGTRYKDLARSWVDLVVQRCPRHNFKTEIIAAIGAEGEAVPGGRIALVPQPAFAAMVNSAPFAE